MCSNVCRFVKNIFEHVDRRFFLLADLSSDSQKSKKSWLIPWLKALQCVNCAWRFAFVFCVFVNLSVSHKKQRNCTAAHERFWSMDRAIAGFSRAMAVCPRPTAFLAFCICRCIHQKPYTYAAVGQVSSVFFWHQIVKLIGNVAWWHASWRCVLNLDKYKLVSSQCKAGQK